MEAGTEQGDRSLEEYKIGVTWYSMVRRGNLKTGSSIFQTILFLFGSFIGLGVLIRDDIAIRKEFAEQKELFARVYAELQQCLQTHQRDTTELEAAQNQKLVIQQQLEQKDLALRQSVARETELQKELQNSRIAYEQAHDRAALLTVENKSCNQSLQSQQFISKQLELKNQSCSEQARQLQEALEVERNLRASQWMRIQQLKRQSGNDQTACVLRDRDNSNSGLFVKWAFQSIAGIGLLFLAECINVFLSEGTSMSHFSKTSLTNSLKLIKVLICLANRLPNDFSRHWKTPPGYNYSTTATQNKGRHHEQPRIHPDQTNPMGKEPRH